MTGVNVSSFTLTRNGAGVPLTGATLATTDGITYALQNLAAATSTTGTYVLSLSPAGIRDIAGNALPAGDSTSFSVDTTPPTATFGPLGNLKTSGPSSETVIFSKPVSGFTLASLSLTLNGSAVPLTGATLVTSDNVTYTIGNLGSVTSQIGSYSITLTAAGSGIVDAVGNSLVGNASQAFTVQAASPIGTPTVVIGDGTAQRSEVRQVVVTFDRAVTLGVGAIDLVRSDGTSIPLSIASPDQIAYTITFVGTTDFGSLQDGRYTLTVHASGVSDGTGNVLTSDSTTSFFRLFGDINGNGATNNYDYGVFLTSYGRELGDANYLTAFDFNGNGAVNNYDYGQFFSRYGQEI